MCAQLRTHATLIDSTEHFDHCDYLRYTVTCVYDSEMRIYSAAGLLPMAATNQLFSPPPELYCIHIIYSIRIIAFKCEE